MILSCRALSFCERLREINVKVTKIQRKMNKKMNKIVIVGGGTAGWMTAAAIVSMLPRGNISVTLVESEAIGIIGVGEATLPHIRFFNETIGIDEAEFMAATSATFKLGIEFVNWARIGDAYIHPFGAYGPAGGDVPFHQYWRKFAADEEIGSISNFSLPIMAANRARFGMPDDDPASILSTYGYAYQFDATQYAPFLRAHAEKRGAIRIEGRVNNVNLDPESGDIQSLELADGSLVEGDLFVDCSGFRGLLIEEHLETGYESWQEWLPCDRAVAAQCRGEGPLLPYTRATAESSGWRWRIPLQHRLGNGHVYASGFMAADEAETILLDQLETPPLTDTLKLSFNTGKRKKAWNRNCVAIGLAGGFLEPLESTAIYLIQTSITQLIELLPDTLDCTNEREEFNRIIDNEFLRVRDFLILHYHATERTDSDFWNHVRTMDIPDSLVEKIELFKARGRVSQYRQGLFLEPSWLAVYLGQRILPEAWDQRVDLAPADKLRGQLIETRKEIARAADSLADHETFINRHCHSEAGVRT